jgi:hypothetical protein
MTGALLVAIALGPGRWGCDAATRFEVAKTATTEVQGGDPLSQLLGVAFPDLATFDLTSESEFQNQGVEKEDIDSVRIETFTLKVVSPSGQDLSFFKKIEFYVETADLPKVLVASQTEFPAGATEVELDLEDVELRDYVAADSMSVTTSVSAQQPKSDTTLEADVTFVVDASAQGACQAIQEAI